MNKLLELAERVEAAKGADQELDAAVFAAVHVDQDLVDQLPDFQADEHVDGGWARIVVPAYTISAGARAKAAAALRARASMEQKA